MSSTPTPTPTPVQKRDRTTLPTVAVLVAVGISAFGFRSESDLLRWVAPLAVVASSLVFALWPRRAPAERKDAPL